MFEGNAPHAQIATLLEFSVLQYHSVRASSQEHLFAVRPQQVLEFVGRLPVARTRSIGLSKSCAGRIRSAFAILTIVVAALIVQQAPTQAATCSNLLLIGARGSGEAKTHDQLGDRVGGFYDQLNSRFAARGLTVDESAVDYAAESTEVLKPTGAAWVSPRTYKRQHLNKFVASINQGVHRAKALISKSVEACPYRRIVLAGYSQGAMVMHQALVQMDAEGNDQLLSISATVLIADGDLVGKTQALRLGDAGRRAEGVRSAIRVHEPDVPGYVSPATWEVCDAKDVVCDFNLSAYYRAHKKKPGGIKIGDAIKVHTTHYGANSPVIRSTADEVSTRLIPSITIRTVAPSFPGERRVRAVPAAACPIPSNGVVVSWWFGSQDDPNVGTGDPSTEELVPWTGLDDGYGFRWKDTVSFQDWVPSGTPARIVVRATCFGPGGSGDNVIEYLDASSDIP